MSATDLQHDDPRDDFLRDAYGDLLVPAVPADALARVGTRIRTRRRRRRAGAALATVAVLAVGGAGWATLGPDGGRAPSDTRDLADDPTGPATPTRSGEPRSTLAVDLPDGTRYTFRDLTVTCDPDRSPAGGGSDGRPHLWAYSGGTALGGPGEPGRPVVILDLRPDLVESGDVLRLPIEVPRGKDAVVPALALVDADTGGELPNEVATFEAGSRGTITVDEISCDPEPVLRLSVDATLASEIGQESLRLTGSLG